MTERPTLNTPPWYPSDDRRSWTHRTPAEQVHHEAVIAKAQAITDEILADERRAREGEPFIAFIETFPEDDPIRVFLEDWRAYRSAQGENCGDGDPFDFVQREAGEQTT